MRGPRRWHGFVPGLVALAWLAGPGGARADAVPPNAQAPAEETGAPRADEPPGASPTPTGAQDPEAPTVSARVSARSVKVGDVVTLTVTAVGPARVPVNLPAHVELGPFELVERTERETPLGDGRMRREFVFRIAAFETGDLTVPSVPLTYLAQEGAVRTVGTEPVVVTVSSLLANEPEPALKANAAPVVVMQEVRWPLYVGAGLLAALMGALAGSLLLARWRRRKKVVPVVPPRPAHERALERLDGLGARLGGTEDLRPFYFELSEVLREYFGARYGFESLELTSDELIFELERHGRKPLVVSEVQGWMATCDLVKFARVAPTETEARGALESALRFVTTTRPPAPPSAALPPAEATHEA